MTFEEFKEYKFPKICIDLYTLHERITDKTYLSTIHFNYSDLTIIGHILKTINEEIGLPGVEYVSITDSYERSSVPNEHSAKIKINWSRYELLQIDRTYEDLIQNIEEGIDRALHKESQYYTNMINEGIKIEDSYYFDTFEIYTWQEHEDGTSSTKGYLNYISRLGGFIN